MTQRDASRGRSNRETGNGKLVTKIREKHSIARDGASRDVRGSASRSIESRHVPSRSRAIRCIESESLARRGMNERPSLTRRKRTGGDARRRERMVLTARCARAGQTHHGFGAVSRISRTVVVEGCRKGGDEARRGDASGERRGATACG